MIQIVVPAIGVIIYFNPEIQIITVLSEINAELTFQLEVVDFVAPIEMMAVQRV